jgi:hypothetical protein
VVELSIGDITCGLARPLAAVIAKLLLMTNEKSPIICERCAIDWKLVLNTNRKPRSLPVSDITEHVKRRNRCEGR